MKVHSTHGIRFTKRAEILTLVANAYKLLFPESTYTIMAEYLGISRSNAHRYYFGLNHGYNIQSIRIGASVPIEMNKEYARKILSNLKEYKKQYNF